MSSLLFMISKEMVLTLGIGKVKDLSTLLVTVLELQLNHIGLVVDLCSVLEVLLSVELIL